MAVVIGVKFKSAGKSYYFDPQGVEYKQGEGVIVETVRGVEYGTVAFTAREVDNECLKGEVKPVLRKATEEDTAQNKRNVAEREHLMAHTMHKVAEHKLPMKVIDAEYTFDRSKIIIYFTAEGRVDFRDLVKDLASVFHQRIELRQIYERDDIKMRGALGQCGRPCCCSAFLPDFEKVSIKMAKVQGLSLNPTKISGCCGKLMCCLKYENAYYQEMAKKMPKVGADAETPEGKAVVVENMPLREECKVRQFHEDGSYEYKTFPLSELKWKTRGNEDKDTDDARE